jgi:hypothetical protein
MIMRKTGVSITGMLVVLLCVLVNSPAASAAAVASSSDPWTIHAYFTPNKCVEVTGASSASGAQIQNYDCLRNAPSHQVWYFDLLPGATRVYYLRSESSGKCMNVAGNSPVNGAKIIQYACDGSLNEQWEVSATNYSNFYQLKTRIGSTPRKCLNVQGASTANGADLILYTCGGGANEYFTWNPVVR